jgi:formylglycine-generating enzyme required for sulfatase activity
MNVKLKNFRLLIFPVFAVQSQDDAPKPSLAVFVVGMQQNQAGDFLAMLTGNELNSGDRYEVITHNGAVQKKLRELREYGGSGNVNGSELIEWGRRNNVSMLCLVTSVKLDEHMFAAQLTDIKSNRLVGSGDCSSVQIAGADLKNVAEELAKQLHGKSGGTQSCGMKTVAAAQRHPAEPEMAEVQGGTFRMGCSQEQQNACENDESPLHSVTLSTFKISKYEITQTQWKSIMGNNPSKYAGDNFPVDNVSWDDVQEFISRLNVITGKNYRLPTEAEWEYAARGGNQCKGYIYSGSNHPDDVAWSSGNSGGQTHAVGTKKANELGIYDMSGNVWEWCLDWYGSYPAAAQKNPTGTKSGSYRVNRGGGRNSNAYHCRVTCRNLNSPGARRDSLGFRVVLP